MSLIWWATLLYYVYGCSLYMYACMYTCAPHVCLVSLEGRRGCWIPWTWITDGWELPWSSGPLEEQPIFITVEHLSSPCYISFIKGVIKSEFWRDDSGLTVCSIYEDIFILESIRSQPTMFLWCSSFWEAPCVPELGDLPASSLQVLGLHESTATPSLISLFCSF